MTDREIDEEIREVEDALRPTLRRRLFFMGLGGFLVLFALHGIVTGAMEFQLNVFNLLLFLIGGRLFYLGADSLPLIEWNEDGVIDRTSLGGETLFIPWSDIDFVSTGRVHSGVRINLREHPACFRFLGPGRMLQRFLSWARGFRGVEINPSFMRLDYRKLGRVLDELVTEAQVRQVREAKPVGELSARDDRQPGTESK